MSTGTSFAISSSMARGTISSRANTAFSFYIHLKNNAMHLKKDEKSEVECLLQDMHIKLRDMDDFSESKIYKRILLKFEKGFEEEYSSS